MKNKKENLGYSASHDSYSDLLKSIKAMKISRYDDGESFVSENIDGQVYLSNGR
ncbi:MAG: hypothetical protein LKF69_02220 [Bacilli bacterium]|nr:hypothetical protein [Bacilli bacterium]MCH4235603.1 hypothetical protein [Bacilli bacterium]HMM00971.1 hypothetical protein [Bacilli bacterium]